MKIINFDQTKTTQKQNCIHPAMRDKHFQMIIAGPSGSGKTNTLLHMIYNLLYFDEILLFAKKSSSGQVSIFSK